MTSHIGDPDERSVELKEAIFNRLFEQAEIAKYTPEERQDYEESLKNFRDWYSCLKTEYKKGSKDTRIEIAQNMKTNGYSYADISSLTGLSEEIIKTLK